MSATLAEHAFGDASAATQAIKAQVQAALEVAISAGGEASMVVSGGKTPLGLFEHLRATDLAWHRVTIALADERWVSNDDAASNERFVRDHLLQAHAAKARFVAMKNSQPTAALGAAQAWSDYAKLARPFAVVLLGMGDDGHTASLFPKNPELRAALDIRSEPACVAMRAPVTPQERLSLNVSALLDTRQIILQCAGEAKRARYEKAKASGALEDMPIRAILRQTKVPVAWYWSP